MNQCSKDDGDVRRVEEIRWVRRELDRMVAQRFVVPLSPGEQVRYRRLTQREHELLDGRLLIIDAAAASPTETDAVTAAVHLFVEAQVNGCP